MASYLALAPFYDQIMGDQAPCARILKELIAEHHPRARSILELGCGTGSVLQHFVKNYDVVGVDLSPMMLSVASRRLRNVLLVQQDMSKLDLNRKFDLIYCVFDSINHLTRFSDWSRLFKRVKVHLNSGGVFIFDMNTEYKLKMLAEKPPWIHEFDQNLLVMNVECDKRGLAQWQIKIFEHLKGQQYQLHTEVIRERSFEIKEVKQELAKSFKKIRVSDFDSGKVGAKSNRLYITCSA